METVITSLTPAPMSLFKSYYVVWKLFFFITRRKKYIKFKSYYVVWKRVSDEKNDMREKSLNRTM